MVIPGPRHNKNPLIFFFIRDMLTGQTGQTIVVGTDKHWRRPKLNR